MGKREKPIWGMPFSTSIGLERLLPGNTISQAEYDRASTTVRTAEAEVRRSDEAVQESKALLAYATIKAPLTGIVIDKKVVVGDTVTPGQTLVTLFNPDKMQMLASVRESLALKLRVGQKLPGRIESLDYEAEATISEIVPEAQASSRSFIVKVVGPCPPGVYSGMFGRIYIPLEDEEIIVVPAAAIKRVGQLEMVQVVADGKLRRRNIQTGRSHRRRYGGSRRFAARGKGRPANFQQGGTAMSNPNASPHKHDFLSGIVNIFLRSNLSIMLIIFSLIVGAAALAVTPREEDPQIVVPLADVYVSFPGRTAHEVEQLVATPLERILYQIDGVEYVYSMSRENQAIITVRFYVGQDRERSLVKLFKKLSENNDTIPPGVTGWVMKPVEIDDVPIVTLTLKGAGGDSHQLRRIAEEAMQRLASVSDVSRAYVVGGEERTVRVDLDPDRLQAYNLSPLEVQKAIRAANVTLPGGDFNRGDKSKHVDAGLVLAPCGRCLGTRRRSVPGSAGLLEGRRQGPRWSCGSVELRSPRLGPGSRVRTARRKSRNADRRKS